MSFLLRWATMLGLVVWVGGFTFYSAVVIPILHDDLGSLESGLVTGRVSDTLNLVGVAALAGCWLTAGLERRLGARWLARVRWGLLTLTSAILAGLMALHPVLDAELAAGSLRAFYGWHKAYLIASTAQWGVNLLLIGSFLYVWQGDGVKPGP